MSLLDTYCEKIAACNVHVSPCNVDENVVLRKAIQKCLRSGTMPPRRVFTNLKLFASQGAPIFYRETLELDIQDIKSAIDIEFSPEQPGQLQHDLVGLLQILDIRQTMRKKSPNTTRMRALSTDSFDGFQEHREHIILDGGRKSRNYLLTLHHQYQGVYGLLSSCTWRATFESGASLQLQLPRGGVDWIMISSSDYDLVPAECRVGGKALGQLPNDADFVFFVRPLEAHPHHIIESCRDIVLQTIEGFEYLDNPQAFDAIMELYERTDEHMLYHLAQLLLRLSSKGVAVAANDGKLEFFEEKPSIARILVTLSQMGTLCENVMYAAFHQRVIDFIHLTFADVQSAVYPSQLLRKAVPFGFYETLAGMSFIDLNTWVIVWSKRRPRNNTEWSDDVFADKWSEDGAMIWKLGRRVVEHKSIYLSFLGEGAMVGDIGEPRLYAHALLLRAFSKHGRLICGIPEGSTVIECNGIVPRVDCADHVLLLRTTFSGDGDIIIHGSPQSKVLICDSVIHVPKGKKLVIGSTHRPDPCRSIAGGDEDAPQFYVIASSHVTCGGYVTGDGGSMVFGFDSRGIGGNDLPLIAVAPCEVVTTISTRNESRSSTHRFSALVPVNRAVNGCSRMPLNYRLFPGGRTFVEAQRDTDLEMLEKRLHELRASQMEPHGGRVVDWISEFKDVVKSRTVWESGFDAELREVIVQATAEYIVEPFIGDMLSLEDIVSFVKHSDWALVKRYWVLDYFVDVLVNGDWVCDIARLIDLVVDMAHSMADDPHTKSEIIRRFNCVYRHHDHHNVRVFGASGRVNGGGAHTDWSHHSVFGMSLDERVFVAGRKLPGHGQITVYSSDVKAGSRKRTINVFEKLDSSDSRSWTNYVVGVIHTLWCIFGDTIPSMDLYVTSNLPMGCGLSSSAALECAVGLTTLRLAGVHLADDDEQERVELAMLCNRVENSFVGVGSGVLDQGVVALGREDHLVFFNCGKPRAKLLDIVPSPLSALGYSVVMIDTGTRRQLQHTNCTGGECYEIGLSDFNRRVARYWIGVALMQIDINPDMSLSIDPVSIDKVTVASSFYLCGPSHHDLVDDGVPVIVSDGGSYRFAGYAAPGQSDECSSVIVVNMVKYMVRENVRVNLVREVLRGDPVGQKDWLISEILRHAKTSRRMGAELLIADKLVNGGDLTQFERVLIFGLLGDLSWEDKRDLFDGDPDRILQSAYDVVQETVTDEYGFIGKACPGAGFGGIAAVIIGDKQYDSVLKACEMKSGLEVKKVRISDGLIEL